MQCSLFRVIILEEPKIYPKYWVGCVSEDLIREATSRKLNLLWRLTRQVQNSEGQATRKGQLVQPGTAHQWKFFFFMEVSAPLFRLFH